MNPEQARQLRDGHLRPFPQPFLPQPDARKRRELHFDLALPDQAFRASLLLAGLPGLEVKSTPKPGVLCVTYELRDYSLAGLETALSEQGFRFDLSFVRRVERAMVHFMEETQLRNMRVPERLIKKSHQIYSKAWDKHLHGDHDETPMDLRQDR